MEKSNKIVIGLTGGIASGKSAVADVFSQLNCDIIDTDIISKEITKAGTYASTQLAKLFPEALLEGVICRSKLRELVFNSESKLKLLNATLHPLIAQEALLRIQNSKSDIIILVVPLLFESGFEKYVDKSVAVCCEKETRIQRLIKRDNIQRELALKIMASQLSDFERKKRADYVIDNNTDKEHLINQVKELYKIFKEQVKQNQ